MKASATTLMPTATGWVGLTKSISHPACSSNLVPGRKVIAPPAPRYPTAPTPPLINTWLGENPISTNGPAVKSSPMPEVLRWMSCRPQAARDRMTPRGLPRFSSRPAHNTSARNAPLMPYVSTENARGAIACIPAATRSPTVANPICSRANRLSGSEEVVLTPSSCCATPHAQQGALWVKAGAAREGKSCLDRY